MLLVLSGVSPGRIAVQTDWQGGPGIPGPVTDWGASFSNSLNSNYLYEYGRLSLSAVMHPEPVDWFVSEETGYSIQTGDMDYDGDIDVVTAGQWNNRVVWFENTDGEGTFVGTPNVILAAPEPEFLAADLDGDGYTDIIYTDETYVYWYHNDGDGTFTVRQIGEHPRGDAAGVADFDNDGDADIVSAGRGDRPALYWFENDGNYNFTPHEIVSSYSGPASYIPTGDLDGDGLADFVISGDEDSHLEWWGDDKGPGEKAFSGHNLALEHHKDIHSCFTWIVDMEKDGDADILATASLDHSLDWWENDGHGNFTRHNISTNLNKGYGVAGLDMDYDGDIDVVTASKNGNHLAWWENDGQQNFTRHIFATGYNNCWAVWAGDISGNGFTDLLSIPGGGGPPSYTYWWELFDHFTGTAELTSSIFDSEILARWDRLEWSAQLNAGGKVRFLVRTSNDPAVWPDWSSCDTISSPTSLTSYVGQYTRYLQYKVILSTTNDRYTPFLYEVRIIYFDTTEDAITETLEERCELRISDDIIHYTLAANQSARLVIYDASGRRLHSLRVRDSGSYEAENLPDGLYFVRLEHNAGTVTRKLVKLH